MDLRDRLRKDNISVSIRRDEYKEILRQLTRLEDNSRDMSEKIWKAVDFYNKKQRQDGVSMNKSKLVDFIKDNFGDPEFKHTEKPLEDCSKGFLEGYISTRLQGEGIDIRMDEMEDVDLSYLEGLLEGSGGKVDTARLRNDSTETSRPPGKAKENREALGKMYAQSVKIQDSELKKRVDAGEMTRAEALREELKDMHDSGNTEKEEDQSQAEANKEKLQNMHEGD